MGNMIRRIQCCSPVLYKSCCPPAVMHNKFIGVGMFGRHPHKAKNPADPRAECCSFQGDAAAAVIQPSFHRHWVWRGNSNSSGFYVGWGDCQIHHQKPGAVGVISLRSPTPPLALHQMQERARGKLCLSLWSLFWIFFPTGEHHCRVLLRPYEKG